MAKKTPDPLSLKYGSTHPGEGMVLTPAQKAQAVSQEPETVKMEVLRDGSYSGEYRHAGDFIDVPSGLVETLTLAGFAARADRAEFAQRDREFAKAVAEASKSTAVAPLSTHDVPGVEAHNTPESEQR